MRTDLLPLIEQFIKKCNNDSTSIILIQHFEILRKCSKRKIKEVFEDLENFYEDKKLGFDKVFMMYFKAGDKKEIKRILTMAPELYSECTAVFIENKLLPIIDALYKGMKINSEYIVKRIDLLKTCREKGVQLALLDYQEV
jgi:hypothetical protein